MIVISASFDFGFANQPTVIAFKQLEAHLLENILEGRPIGAVSVSLFALLEIFGLCGRWATVSHFRLISGA